MSGAPKVTAEQVSKVLLILTEWKRSSRQVLSQSSGLSDRRVRACLREIDLADDHNAVVHYPDGGYGLATDPATIYGMAAELRSRIANENQRALALELTAYRLQAHQRELPLGEPNEQVSHTTA